MGKWKKGAKRKGARRWRVKALIKKHHGQCVVCSVICTLTHNADDQATVDHITPLSKGGAESLDNLQLLCRKCNVSKGDSIIGEDGEIVEEEE